jgi:hypothetical protein
MRRAHGIMQIAMFDEGVMVSSVEGCTRSPGATPSFALQ